MRHFQDREVVVIQNDCELVIRETLAVLGFEVVHDARANGDNHLWLYYVQHLRQKVFRAWAFRIRQEFGFTGGTKKQFCHCCARFKRPGITKNFPDDDEMVMVMTFLTGRVDVCRTLYSVRSQICERLLRGHQSVVQTVIG